LVVAHRGGSYVELIGEQTTAHFERAAKLEVDFIEVDIRETADRRLICMHDPEYAGLSVAGSTYTELVSAARSASIPVPALLGELIEISRGRVSLDLELKVGGIEQHLVDEVSSFDRQIIFKCFDDAVVRTLKKYSPASIAGLLLGVRKPRLGPLTRMSELFPGARAKLCHADFVSPHYRLLRFGFIKRMRLLGLPVLVWTVNDPAIAARVLSAGAGVITDQPELCLKLRRSPAP
jgi:glycerophosphoryl diester phosphodiesterase